MDSMYKKLLVWQKSIELVKNIYQVTKKYPKEELYSLVDQIKRSAVSISSNIAEWSSRNWNKEFINFLHIAKWSATELETQIIISKELWFISDEDYKLISEKIIEILKMLSSLIFSKKSKLPISKSLSL